MSKPGSRDTNHLRMLVEAELKKKKKTFHLALAFIEHLKGFWGTQTLGYTILKMVTADICPSTVLLSNSLTSHDSDGPNLLDPLNISILTSSSFNKTYGFPRQMVKPVKHTKLFIYHK